MEALESRAESLRARGETGEPLTETVAALENLRLALLKLGRGLGSVDDLTAQLARAKDIGERVERQIAAQQEVAGVLGRGAGGTA